jgi:hypothetical protein
MGLQSNVVVSMPKAQTTLDQTNPKNFQNIQNILTWSNARKLLI